MNFVMLLWAGVAGAACVIAAVHGASWLLDRRSVANLAFCVVAVAVAGLSITELGMMHSASGAEYGHWLRWFHLPNFFVVVGLVVFVQLQFGSGRAWLAGLIVALRILLLAVNFVVHPNVTFSEISSVRTISFLGEPVSVIASAVVRQPVQWLGTLASVLFILYVADALAKAWRQGDRHHRRKVLVICGSILAFVTLAILESQLVVWNVLQMPVVIAPLFLILLGAITYEISRDIAASLRAEREARRMRNELERASRLHTIGQLSGALAHELSQPLTSILANAQAAQSMLQTRRPDVPELLEILADICTADRRAHAIIERTRALMKHSRMELREVPVSAIVRDVLAAVRVDAMKRGIALESSVPEALPHVRADRVQISQVLLNLVINALESFPAETLDERSVRIEAKPVADGLVEVAVVDRGSGIRDDMVARLFDAFETSKPTGLGIGLAVAKMIVRAHGGELRGENNPGRGATFTFTLQAASAELRVAQAAPLAANASPADL
jgi:signal transduction histidine kinase